MLFLNILLLSPLGNWISLTTWSLLHTREQDVHTPLHGHYQAQCCVHKWCSVSVTKHIIKNCMLRSIFNEYFYLQYYNKSYDFIWKYNHTNTLCNWGKSKPMDQNVQSYSFHRFTEISYICIFKHLIIKHTHNFMVANENVNSCISFFRLFFFLFFFCPKRKGLFSHMLARKRTRSWDM